MQIIVAELEVLNKDHSGKNSPCSADVIIACCTKLVVSPTLGNIFSGHDGQLVSNFTVHVCHVYISTFVSIIGGILYI